MRSEAAANEALAASPLPALRRPATPLRKQKRSFLARLLGL